jgi:hypothetical protein
MKEIMKIQEAARFMGISEQQLRLLIQNKLVDFGVYMRQAGNSRGSYYIWKEKFKAYVKSDTLKALV